MSTAIDSTALDDNLGAVKATDNAPGVKEVVYRYDENIEDGPRKHR